MVQARTVWIIALVSYLVVFITILTYAQSLKLLTGDWIQLFLLLVAVGVLMFNFVGQILKALKQPKLKILNPQVKIQSKGTQGEFKDVDFDVWNDAGQEAIEIQIKVKVKGLWQDFYLLPPRYNDIIPDGRRTFRLCQPIKSEEKVVIGNRKNLPLDRGKMYDIEIRFYGKNFRDRKTHRLKLDLSSWENIGIILDC